MGIPFKSDIDLDYNQIKNVRIQVQATEPATGVLGQLYYNSTSKEYFQYDGTRWKQLGSDLPGNVIISEDLSVKGIISLTAQEYEELQNNNELEEDVLYAILDDGVENTFIVDNLTSTSTTQALSANQGRILNNMIGDIGEALDLINGEYEVGDNMQF